MDLFGTQNLKTGHILLLIRNTDHVYMYIQNFAIGLGKVKIHST